MGSASKGSIEQHGRVLRVPDDYFGRVLQGSETLLFDGAMGTMLQALGLDYDGPAELLSLSQPESIAEIHRRYVEAGSQVVTTNTFGASRLKLASSASVDEVFAAGIGCARESGARYVAADMGPLGELLEPYGDLEPEEAVELFAEQAVAAQAHGADLVIVETMTDLTEAAAAVQAVRENTELPVFVTMSFGAHGKTFMGVGPEDVVEEFDAIGVEALGVNCSLGPVELAPVVESMLAATSTPVIVQANAGLPNVVDGKTTYGIAPDEYAQAVGELVQKGVCIVGGCCGTNPDYIHLLAQALQSATAGSCS